MAWHSVVVKGKRVVDPLRSNVSPYCSPPGDHDVAVRRCDGRRQSPPRHIGHIEGEPAPPGAEELTVGGIDVEHRYTEPRCDAEQGAETAETETATVRTPGRSPSVSATVGGRVDQNRGRARRRSRPRSPLPVSVLLPSEEPSGACDLHPIVRNRWSRLPRCPQQACLQLS